MQRVSQNLSLFIYVIVKMSSINLRFFYPFNKIYLDVCCSARRLSPVECTLFAEKVVIDFC